MTAERRDWIDGYEAPIKRALWERITSFGAPRLWATIWICLSLYVGLLTVVALGFKWLLIPGLVWLAGHGLLVGLTLWDVDWDSMGIAQVTRRYRDYYDAG